MGYNIINNIFVEEMINFLVSATNKKNNMFNFIGNPTKFEVEIIEGTKCLRYKNNTIKYAVIDGNILTKDNLDFLLQKRFYLCTFKNVDFKSKEITNDLNQCVFENCYFRNAKFDNIKIIGAKFYNCNLKSSIFINVNLEHVTFSQCIIKYEQLKKSIGGLYSKEAVRLTENLLTNANNNYDSEEISLIQDILKMHTLKYLKEKTFLTKNEHYSSRLFIEKFWNLIKYLGLQFKRIFFGFNLRIKNILISLILTSLVFTLIYMNLNLDGETFTIMESINISLDTLISNSEFTISENGFLYFINLVHNILIYVLYGSLLVAIIKKVDK